MKICDGYNIDNAVDIRENFDKIMVQSTGIGIVFGDGLETDVTYLVT